MTRTDDELLALAAKAGGIDGAKPWNPLTDDGDALKLAVKLRMCVDHGYEMAFANLTIVSDDQPSIHAEADEDYSDHGGDTMAATRRAIVRAAAQIGEQTP